METCFNEAEAFTPRIPWYKEKVFSERGKLQ